MHGVILGVGLWATASAACAAPAADCPRRDAALVEQFIGADCPDCWRAGDPAAAGSPGWRFDWIVPAPGDAALSAASLPEALERSIRAGAGSAPAARWLTRSRTLAPPRGTALAVSAGPAWHGYLGVQVDASGPWPMGSSIWLALVELLPAASEGNATPRALVRSVVGPLPAGRDGHLHAMRWPETAQLDRLQPRGWVEAAGGAILAVASPDCPLN